MDANVKTQTIGIFGGGQLGRMLAQASLPLGIQCVFLEDAPNCPSASLGKVFTTDQFDEFCNASDCFTLEFENTPVQQYATLNQAANKHCYPNETVLSVAQDRLKEKQTFKDLGITTVPFSKVSSIEELTLAKSELGLPLVLKTTRGGYDGKGQFIVKTPEDIEKAWDELGKAEPLIAEGFINFEREVSIIAVRSISGEIKTYPLVQNHHHEGILAKSIAPAPNQEQIKTPAIEAITKLMNHFNYVGVMTLELFVTKNGIIANEIAPRVHNSGHWSIEGAQCSQFENHIRAVAGLPLGSTDIVHPSAMLNIIGKYPKTEDVLSISSTHLHLYNKSERTDRKIGHITIMPNKSENLDSLVHKTALTLPNTMDLV